MKDVLGAANACAQKRNPEEPVPFVWGEKDGLNILGHKNSGSVMIVWKISNGQYQPVGNNFLDFPVDGDLFFDLINISQTIKRNEVADNDKAMIFSHLGSLKDCSKERSFNLGRCYARGFGASPDFSKARFFLEKSGSDVEKYLFEGSFSIFLPFEKHIDMIQVNPGGFLMGSPSTEEDRDADETQHLVKMKKKYWIGKTEITESQYSAVMQGIDNGSQLPQANISWQEAKDFCEKLNEITQETRPQGYEYDLPTEAQWEYACRGGQGYTYQRYSGSNKLEDVTNYETEKGKGRKVTGLREVANSQPNNLGLYDMSGNVAEWCLDYYQKDISMKADDPCYQNNAEGRGRVIRGGAFNSRRRDLLRSAHRDYREPKRQPNVGFRIVLVHKEK